MDKMSCVKLIKIINISLERLNEVEIYENDMVLHFSLRIIKNMQNNRENDCISCRNNSPSIFSTFRKHVNKETKKRVM